MVRALSTLSTGPKVIFVSRRTPSSSYSIRHYVGWLPRPGANRLVMMAVGPFLAGRRCGIGSCQRRVGGRRRANSMSALGLKEGETSEMAMLTVFALAKGAVAAT